VSGRAWTSQEDAELLRIYPTAQWRFLLRAFPDRTREGITQHAQFLEISRELNARNAWTGAEKKLLAALYPTASRERIIGALPRHSKWGTIVKMANTMGLKREFDVVAKHQRHPIVRKLRASRRERGILLVDLSRKIGAHPVQLARWESGQQMPRLRSFFDWVQALNFELVLRDSATAPYRVAA
jgi:hypothetical protein